MRKLLTGGLMALFFSLASVHADAIDANANLQRVLDEALLDLHGGRWNAALGEKLEAGKKEFAKNLKSPEAAALWDEKAGDYTANEESAARTLGTLQARVQHVAALEMVWRQEQGDVEGAKEWRAIIKLPKYANAVNGAMALQRMGGVKQHQAEVSRLLSSEYLLWQITRAREKADALGRLVDGGRAVPSLVVARASEIQALSTLPDKLMNVALPDFKPSDSDRRNQALTRVLESTGKPAAELGGALSEWRVALEGGYPNLLNEEEVGRRENMVLKLLRLIPMEYQSGVRDGEVVIPIEYREAKSFTIQSQQFVAELLPVWRQSKADAFTKHGPDLITNLEKLEQLIARKASLSEVESAVKVVSNSLQSDFGLALKRAGTAAAVVEEATLEIRSLLGQSLAAAQNGQWRKAEALRLDAYVNFDLEIEARAMPRDPTLALNAEKTFLDGTDGRPGIKAALDARMTPEQLTAAYQTALDAIDECTALLKVGLSPSAATFSAVLIVAREGLEAVVILAALLAGLRGPENAQIRRQIGIGAWLALVASALLFVVSRYLLAGLSKYGETLEAVISIIAVIILLMVTNWVFHKYYWTGWNAKLRELSKAALAQQGGAFERLALVGVGFATIFREGFETTLFMQSLILEAGMNAVLKGLLIGGAMIAVMGYAVFYIGAKLPYRKMLVYTGMLVMVVLFTFLGSTTRLFQTVGWLPIHPIEGLRLPNWVGMWFGVYPTWEGVIIPFLAFVYVLGAWLWVKATSKSAQAKAAAKVVSGKAAAA